MKGQGSLEYLIITAAVLAISAVVVLFITGAFGSIKADVSACKQAAATCKITMITTTNPTCSNCETSCKDPSGKDVMKDLGETCGPACLLCKKGDATKIGASPGTPTELKQESSQVALWHFNENTGSTTTDSSNNGNTGTINSATWTTNGKFGNALTFDGVNDYVDCGDATSLNPTIITVEAWVKFNTVPYTNQIGIDRSSSYRLIASDVSAGYLSARFATTVVGWGSGTVIGKTPLMAGVWYHVAFTYEGSYAKVWLNGVEDGSTAATGNLATSAGKTIIGNYNALAVFWFKGTIDEVAIYNRAKTASEIYVDANY